MESIILIAVVAGLATLVSLVKPKETNHNESRNRIIKKTN